MILISFYFVIIQAFLSYVTLDCPEINNLKSFKNLCQGLMEVTKT